ncbi:MAG TPA: phenylacetate--CoA ligase family protein [Planctomycetes bacterium]|nr:phenylacetate--CoA ligase family protein [Planctomycetota bacterium]
MSDRRYWNPKWECAPKSDLRALQLEKLRRSVAWAVAKSPFHRRLYEEAGVGVDDLKTLDDIRRLPFMTREDWMASQAEKPFFGDVLTASREHAIRYHLTSGTSGRQPLRVLDGGKDWQWISECWAYGFWGFGVRPEDTVFFAFSYGSFIGFWGAHYCCEKIGALTIPSGNMTTENRVRQLVEMEATTVCATPTYAIRLALEAEKQGLDLPGSSVNKLIVSGEPAGSIPAMKRLLEEKWGAKCADTAGMTELGTIMMFECAEQPGGAHIIEDHFIEEVLDPETDDPVSYGEMGERVVTSFGRGMIPVIRYRTKDLVVKVPHDHCSCGRTFDIFEGGIQGRVDDMLLIRGTNVYPRAVEAIVREYDEVDEFQIVAWRREDAIDELTVKVEFVAGFTGDRSGTLSTLAADLKRNHEGLRINVEEAAEGSLPRFELKAKRLIDRRNQG